MSIEDELSNAENEISRGEMLIELIEKKLDYMIKNPPKKDTAQPSDSPASKPAVDNAQSQASAQ